MASPGRSNGRYEFPDELLRVYRHEPLVLEVAFRRRR